MGEALIRGLVVGAGVDPDRVGASDPRSDRLAELSNRYAIHVTTDNRELVGHSQVLVLAVKPQILGQVLGEIGAHVPESTLVISICAGVATATIEAAMAHPVRVIRTMPNTPALVQAGATAIARGARATAADESVARFLFEAVGLTVSLDESLLDAVTGLSGSGPGYMFLILEALIAGGVDVGLSPNDARKLAAQTMLGTARLLLETDGDPRALRDMVTSPGGTTLAGVRALEDGEVSATIRNAVKAATARSRELGALAAKTS